MNAHGKSFKKIVVKHFSSPRAPIILECNFISSYYLWILKKNLNFLQQCKIINTNSVFV